MKRKLTTLVTSVVLGLLVAGSAFALSYDTTGTLNHSGFCIGYGWANSNDTVGAYAGTNMTGGGGPCYRKVDGDFYYNNGSHFNPGTTGYQSYDVAQGAGPNGTCDDAYGDHYVSWTAGDTGAPHGNTHAFDC